MNATGWLPIIFGAIQTIYTVMLFHLRAPKMNSPLQKPVGVSQGKLRLFVVLTILTWVAIAYNYFSIYHWQISSWLNGGQLELVIDKTISNQIVVLDGHSYRNCVFHNVTFEFDGGKFDFAHNYTDGAQFKTSNPDIDITFFVLAKLGLLRIPVLDNNGKLVEPGATWSGPRP
jgi:hypothetical protein